MLNVSFLLKKLIPQHWSVPIQNFWLNIFCMLYLGCRYFLVCASKILLAQVFCWRVSKLRLVLLFFRQYLVDILIGAIAQISHD
jgi:hypothetical protein